MVEGGLSLPRSNSADTLSGLSSATQKHIGARLADLKKLTVDDHAFLCGAERLFAGLAIAFTAATSVLAFDFHNLRITDFRIAG